jgi:hypothetical protein
MMMITRWRGLVESKGIGTFLASAVSWVGDLSLPEQTDQE